MVLAKQNTGSAGGRLRCTAPFVPFTAQTRMSGVDMDGRQIRKGAADAVAAFVKTHAGTISGDLAALSNGSPAAAARRWWSPTAAARSA